MSINQKIVDYLQQNKDQYSKEDLIKELHKIGFSEKDIQLGVNSVYEKSSNLNADTQIVDYLNKNKDEYSKESLVKELEKFGYSKKDIEIGIAVVYDLNTFSKSGHTESGNAVFSILIGFLSVPFFFFAIFMATESSTPYLACLYFFSGLSGLFIAFFVKNIKSVGLISSFLGYGALLVLSFLFMVISIEAQEVWDMQMGLAMAFVFIFPFIFLLNGAIFTVIIIFLANIQKRMMSYKYKWAVGIFFSMIFIIPLVAALVIKVNLPQIKIEQKEDRVVRRDREVVERKTETVKRANENWQKINSCQGVTEEVIFLGNDFKIDYETIVLDGQQDSFDCNKINSYHYVNGDEYIRLEFTGTTLDTYDKRIQSHERFGDQFRKYKLTDGQGIYIYNAPRLGSIQEIIYFPNDNVNIQYAMRLDMELKDEEVHLIFKNLQNFLNEKGFVKK